MRRAASARRGDGHLGEPVGRHENIVIAKNDDLSARLGDRAVARVVKPLPGLVDIARSRVGGGEPGDNRGRVIGGIVVDDEHLKMVARKLLSDDARQGLAQEVGAIIGWNRDGDFHWVKI